MHEDHLWSGERREKRNRIPQLSDSVYNVMYDIDNPDEPEPQRGAKLAASPKQFGSQTILMNKPSYRSSTDETVPTLVPPVQFEG